MKGVARSLETFSSENVVSNLAGGPRMLDVLRCGLGASTRLSIAVSFFRFSGFALVVSDLAEFVERGGKLRLLISTFMSVTQPDALRAVLAHPGIEARLHLADLDYGVGQGLHAKMYVMEDDPAECWIGSSNFTKGGLASNLEANLRHDGTAAVAEVRQLFESLWLREDTVPLDEAVIDRYEIAYRASELRLANARQQEVDDTRALYGHVRPNQAQAEALDRLKDLRETGERRAAIVAAPGVGKTFLAAFDARARNASSMLFLSNRLEHLTQAERTFRRVFGEARTYGVAYGGKVDASADFVFATIASATNDQDLIARKFDYVVVDEFHHASAPSYRALLSRLDYAFLLGLTATPERQDGHDVLSLCDYNVAYEIRLVDAINRGWLSPFHYFGVADESVDYAAIPWRSGRFDPEQLEAALMVEGRVQAMLDHCLIRGFDGHKRVAVGFCAGVRHARYMADALTRRGLSAAAVTGSDSVFEREAIYARLQDPADALEWLFVADVLNEGVDLPAINTVIFLRPTESATIFIQQLGRGLRLTPGSEVLTVLDFVGHHRTAWLAVEALNDHGAPRGPSTVDALDLTPPAGCEIVLDARTLEILEKVRKFAPSRKDLCLAAYARLRQEFDIARPQPIDLLTDASLPTPQDVRAGFGSWIGLREAAGDAEDWELSVAAGGAAFDLLRAAEIDWQAQRVYPYAALWGMCARPDDRVAGYEAFFERFPRWRVEYAPFTESKVTETLRRKLGELFDGESLFADALAAIPRDRLVDEIEGRLQYTLERDFRLRHGGVLRRPSDLVLHRLYSRPEIVNHFGSQYDPARHNTGVLRFGAEGEHFVILVKLDTTTAIDRHQYRNVLEGDRRFIWTSQNQQSRSKGTGRDIVEHRASGTSLHLFVQPASHSPAIYMGVVDCDDVVGDKPMQVTLGLRERIPQGVLEQLGSAAGSDE